MCLTTPDATTKATAVAATTATAATATIAVATPTAATTTAVTAAAATTATTAITATPSWKVVIFGGMTFDSSGREECSNTTLVWDVEQQQCSQPADGGEETRPDPRAEPALAYNERTQRLCLIGGWNLAAIAELFDPYLSSIHQLDISSVRAVCDVVQQTNVPRQDVSQYSRNLIKFNTFLNFTV